MARLFTALWPPPPVVAELDAALARAAHSDAAPAGGTDLHRWPPEGWRAIPSRRWHVTLRFHGEADPGTLARRLDTAATGLAAPWLRLSGAVSLGAVIAAAVHTAGPADTVAMAALVAAAGADPATHVPHVSVARTARRSDAPPAGGPLDRFAGSWWRPDDVCLVLSESSSGSARYTVLHRVPLAADPTCATPGTDHPRVSEPTRCQRRM